MQHPIDEVQAAPDERIVRTRIAPAATRLGLLITYRWTSEVPIWPPGPGRPKQ